MSVLLCVSVVDDSIACNCTSLWTFFCLSVSLTRSDWVLSMVKNSLCHCMPVFVYTRIYFIIFFVQYFSFSTWYIYFFSSFLRLVCPSTCFRRLAQNSVWLSMFHFTNIHFCFGSTLPQDSSCSLLLYFLGKFWRGNEWKTRKQTMFSPNTHNHTPDIFQHRIRITIWRIYIMYSLCSIILCCCIVIVMLYRYLYITIKII